MVFSVRAALAAGLALAACGAPPPRAASAPPPLPTPASVTRAEPGGDATDAHAAALGRLLSGAWGPRPDRDQQLLVALPDADNWKRVRYWGFEHFVGFRYGDDHHALYVVFVQDVPDEHPSSEDCMKSFEAWGRARIQSYDVNLTPFQPHFAKFREHALIAFSTEGKVSLGFSRPEFSAAWAAYAIYPRACLISAVAVPWRTSRDLADKVRDRFVSEGFALMQPLTPERPYRK